MLTGKHTSLRAIESADLPLLLKWRNRPEFRQYFREFRELSLADQEEWFKTINRRESNARMFAIESPVGGELVGACGLCYLDAINRSADLSIYIGKDDLYIDDTIAPDAAKVLIKFGFEELNLHRIWSEIYEIDNRKKKFFQQLGFKLEGQLRETHWTNGSWCDSLYFGLLDSDHIS